MKANNVALDAYRIRDGRLASDESFGNTGAFLVPRGTGCLLQIIASDGGGWDHVSVVPVDRKGNKLYRTPTWAEMVWVKNFFFGPEECVVQFHPPRSQYRNSHEYCLHLWRPQGIELPLPDPLMVAPP